MSEPARSAVEASAIQLGPHALYTTLRTGAAAAPIRAFLAQTYGQLFHDEVLDLP